MPIVEQHDISDDDEMHHKNIQIEIPEGDLQEIVKIKIEKIEILQGVIGKLNQRIGTELVEADDEKVSSSFARSRKNTSENINTLIYQIDKEFGKSFYYINNVRMPDIELKRNLIFMN